MRNAKNLVLWLLLMLLGLTTMTSYAAPEKDKDKDKPQRQAVRASKSGSAACEPGNAAAFLDINNVSAPVYNTGSLFYPDQAGIHYEIPKGSGNNAIFATNIWVGGMANGELRMAAATYAQFGEDYEFFPGPLAADGTPPSDCTQYDRIYKINRTDIENYDLTGTAAKDLAEWPWQLGAPVVDGDGNPNNYDLAAGDRPELLGDQMLWWVMNDAAGEHLTTLTPPVGLEVQATAFAFSTADALNNTTFYKFKLIYKPLDNATLNDAWLGIWADTDLGNYTDDFVGVDTTLGLGFSYNGDNLDEGVGGYGNQPPAVGYDFFQGPLVDSNGDGQLDEETDERLGTTRFVYYNNTNGIPTGNPADAEDMYGYLKGIWTDNQPMTVGGNGYGGTQVTDYIFPGDPPNFWSEDNTDGKGSRNTPADRRLLMSTGPFEMNPGDTQEIVFGVVWSQTADRIGSVKKLKKDDILAQGAFDFDFNLPPPPAAPVVTASEQDGTIVLSWGYQANQNNYLNQYDEPSPYLIDTGADDQTYTFEGYKIFQYPNAAAGPEDGTLIATFDVANNVLSIVDSDIDPQTGAAISRVVAQGTDSGVQNHIVINKDVFTDRQLRNFTQYYFGVQAYAYNQNSDPKIYQSPVTRVTVTPSDIEPRAGGTELRTEVDADLSGELTAGAGEGTITARVVDPLAVTGDKYDVRFYRVDLPEGGTGLTYDVVNQRTGEKIVNGQTYLARTGKLLPQGPDIFVHEGLSFGIAGPTPTFTAFLVTSNAAGPVDPPTQGTACFNANGFPCLFNGVDDDGDGEVDEADEVDRPSARQQVGAGRWIINAGGGTGSFASYLARTVRGGWDPIVPYDFELRFTEEGGYAWSAYAGLEVTKVPFEIWRTGIGTPNDPSDDVRLIPYFFDENGDGEFTLNDLDHGVSGGDNDPYTDWIYWFLPEDFSPGEAGYNAWEAQALAFPVDPATGKPTPPSQGEFFGVGLDSEVMARVVLVNFNAGSVATGTYTAEMPETGTTFRIVTSKPIQAGDVYTIDTANLNPVRGDAEVAVEALDRIGIVPNPYRARSDYDVSLFQAQARVTNLPQEATIRIYALNGTLIRTLQKNNPDEDFLAWDLRTQEGLPIASGIYLVHVTVPNVGDRILKFGVVQRRIQLDVF